MWWFSRSHYNGGPPFNFGFNFPGSPTALFSVRLANTSYTGNCVNVYRYSDANTHDIGFTTQGLLDWNAANTFANGSSLYVMTWYDQSGHGNNAIATSYQTAPFLINSGGNGPQITFSGAAGTLDIGGVIGLNSDFTIGLYMQQNGYLAGTPIECWDEADGWVLYLNGSAIGQVDTIFNGTVEPGDTSNLLAGSLHQVAITRASGNTNYYVDNAITKTITTSSSNSTANAFIGSFQGSAFPFQGMISDLYIYTSALSNTQLSTIYNNELLAIPPTGFQNYYNGKCAIQAEIAAPITFGNVLEFEFTQPWTMYAAVQVLHPGGITEAGIISNIDHSNDLFQGYFFGMLSSVGTPFVVGALTVRLINSIPANQAFEIQGSKSIIDGKIHCVVATYDGSGLAAGVKLYIDGVEDTVDIVSDTLGGNSIVGPDQILAVGGQVNDTDCISGRVGFAQIDTVVRSQAYIAENFTLSVTPPNDGANTVLRLLLTEGTGTTTADTSSSGLTGTLVSQGVWVPNG
jgi:Concanavalin A-like lectin/glucanases superfamily